MGRHSAGESRGTLVELFSQRAESEPDAQAYTFLDAAGNECDGLTWRDVDRRARARARQLHAAGVGAADRVLVMLPPGLDYLAAIVGVLYAGAVAVPMPHGTPRRLGQRLDAIAVDCAARAVICPAETIRSFDSALTTTAARSLAWCASELAGDDGANFTTPEIQPDAVAIIQYTSGSISTPKGVALSHHNIIENESLIKRAFAHDSATVVVGWLPFYHDMGLIGNVLQPAFVGCCCILMSPFDFFQEPWRWLDAIAKYRGTTAGAPNFAYELCVRRTTPQQRAALDLSSWRVAFNAAEPVRAATLDRFVDAFGPSGFRAEAFYPCYGLAEAVLFVTGGEAGRLSPRTRLRAIETDSEDTTTQDPQAREFVSSGRVWPGQTVEIVEPSTCCGLADGSVGEIWVRSASVAEGYFNRPLETAATFGAHRRDSGAGPYLRTGDLGFLLDGELYVTGRSHDLVILRGRKYHPHDIERTAEVAVPALCPGGSAAFSVTVEGEERLVLVSEVEHRSGFNSTAAAAAVRQAVANEHDVAIYAIAFVRAGQVPRTTSGKTRRRACRDRYLDGTLVRLSSETADEPTGSSVFDELRAGVVVNEVAALLNINPSAVAVDKPLAALGVDSIMALRLLHALELRAGVRLPLGALLQADSLRAIARTLADGPSARTSDAPPARLLELRDLPLSQGQLSLWSLAEAAPNSAAYNLGWAGRLRGPLMISALETAWSGVVGNHTALRTTFRRVGTAVREHVEGPPAAVMSHIDARDWSEPQLLAELRAQIAKPFDLGRVPFEVQLYRRGDREHVLLVRVHHIIADLASADLIFDELIKRYMEARGGALQPRSAASNYADFVAREIAYLESREADEALTYWRTQLVGGLPVLALRSTSSPQPPHGAPSFRFEVEPGLARAVRVLARQTAATSHTVLLATFMLLLARWTHDRDILVGTPAADRDETWLAGLVGYCVNVLPIRVDLAPDPSFRQLIEQVRRKVLAALVHCRLPFRVLADRLDLRCNGGEPLIQAAFVWHGQTGPRGHHWLQPGGATRRFDNLELDVLDIPREAAEFGLVLTMAESEQGFTCRLECDGQQFDPAMLDRLAGAFGVLLAAATAAPDMRVMRLPLVSAAERETLLGSFAGPELELPREATLPALIRAPPRRPARIALAGALGGPVAGSQLGDVITESEFEDLTGRLAAGLREVHGVGRGDVVGVLIERSAALAIAVHAIVAAGAAYLPLDPANPDQRNDSLLRDAGCRVLLTRSAHADRLSFCGVRVDIAAADAFAAAPGVPCEVAPEDLVYVIYTSGSTGQPKGVMLEHRSVVNRLLWMAGALDFNDQDVVLHKTPSTFDVSVWELFLPFVVGCRLVLLAPGDERDAARIFDSIRRHGVTTAHFVPSMLSALLLHCPEDFKGGSWRRCICSGEALHASLRDRFLETFADNVALFNLYGPTEAAIDVTWHKVSATEAPVPIGRPVANTAIRILDRGDQLVPVGSPGELCIAGVQVARGYLNRDDLTRRSIGEDPYEPGVPMYRTGDWARWRADGCIEYLGRRDAQIKIRGQRIEPAEVEAVLRTYPGVIDAAVSVGGSGEVPHLVASLVMAIRPPQRILKAFVRQRLPAAMIPDSYLFVDALPLNDAGKLDRRRLGTATRASSRSFVPARGRDEQTLVSIWQDELGFEQIGIDDSFFDLGGDFIRGLRVVARAKAAGIAFSMADLYRLATIRLLGAIAAPAEELDEDRKPFGLIPVAWRDRLPQNVEDAYPLSALQSSLVHLSQSNANYEIYVTTLRVRATFNADALRTCLQQIVARHAFLRVFLDLTGFSRPLQCVQRQTEVPCRIVDWRHLPEVDQQHLLENWLAGERKRAFDWTKAPMLRMTIHRRTNDVFQFTMSDAALDGWCVASLITELFEDYLAVAAGAALPFRSPIAASHRDFVEMEQRCAADADARQFWSGVLRRLDLPPLRLPAPSATATEPLQHRVVTTFEDTEWEKIGALARQLSVPVKNVLLAVHLRVLALLAGPATVTGIELNGRPEVDGGDRVIGAFNNMVPLPLALRTMTWSELAVACWRAEQDIYPFRRYPYAQLRREAGHPLFDAVFVYTAFHVYERLLDRSDFEVLDADGSDKTFFPMTAHFNWDVRADKLRLILDVDPSVWPPDLTAAAASAYAQALRQMLIDPGQRIDAVKFADASEPQRSIPVAPVLCYHEMFAQRAGLHPDRIAVVDGERWLSYRRLDDAANGLAHRLQTLGVRAAVPIGVYLPRSPAMVIALLAAAKAGGAYVPLDSTLPRDHLLFMMRDSGTRCVITTSELAEAVAPEFPVVLVGETADAAPAGLCCVANLEPGNAAYILYTSGSTGRPKGVMIDHRALSNYLNWATGAYRLTGGGTVPVHTSIGFDLTVTSLLAPLVAGDTVDLLPDPCEPDELVRVLDDGAEMSLLKITPSHLAGLAHYRSASTRLAAPQTIVIGGESLYAEQLARWPESAAATIYNEYGPTEATVGCCAYRVPAQRPTGGAIPIGHAIANARLFLTDDWGALVPSGTIGELLIGGPGLARGYLNDPGATAARFIPDSFGSQPGERLHRSGDLVRQLPGGELEYVNRRDRQIKYHGFRIDPGQIEATLAAHPAIRAAVVTLERTSAGSTRLVAHVASDSDRAPSFDEVRRWLVPRLPNYMIPSVVVAVDQLPLTINGKVDRAQLTNSRSGGTRCRNDQEFVAADRTLG